MLSLVVFATKVFATSNSNSGKKHIGEFLFEITSHDNANGFQEANTQHAGFSKSASSDCLEVYHG